MNTFAELERDENVVQDRGNWILTYTGKQFFIENPLAEDVCIEDIAHALSMICRFTGHCTRFYSVAEHSLLVTNAVPKKFRPFALLHDAEEAYVSDLARPLKSLQELAYYRQIENRILAVVLGRFGLHPGGDLWIPPEVKFADLRALAAERRDLMVQAGPEWNLGVEPLEQQISCMAQYGIEDAFLTIAKEYGLE